MGTRFIPHIGVKSIPKGDAVATKANHVFGLPLIVSTRSVKPITSKATVLNKALVPTKSRSREGTQKPKDLTLKSQEEWVVLLHEHPLTLQNTLLRKVGKNDFFSLRVRVSP